MMKLISFLLIFLCTALFAKEDAIRPFPEQKVHTFQVLEPKLWVELLSFNEQNPAECIELVRGSGEQDFTPGHNSWYADMQKYTLAGYAKGKLSTRWKEYTFIFIPKKSGRVWLRIGGRWSRESYEQNWVLVNFVKLNGKFLPNGNFEKYREISLQRNVPVNWQLAWNAKYLPEGGDKKTPACLINHSNRLSTMFQVTANQEYRITVKAKLPPGRYAVRPVKKNNDLVF